MESVVATTIALVLAAGPVLSFVQERWFSKVEGPKAFWLSVGLALAFGVAGTMKSAYAGTLPPATDLFSFGVNVFAVGSAVLIGSQAAFRILVKPVAARPPA